jgi:hypothetical protein
MDWTLQNVSLDKKQQLKLWWKQIQYQAINEDQRARSANANDQMVVAVIFYTNWATQLVL